MFVKPVTLMLTGCALSVGFSLVTGCQNAGGGGGYAANDEALYLFDDGTSNIPQRSGGYVEPAAEPEPQPVAMAAAPNIMSDPAPAAPAQQYASNDTQYYTPDPTPAPAAQPEVRRAAISTGGGSSSQASSSTSSYTVRRGDTLSKIARAHGMTVSRLKSLNGLSSNLIHPGQSLAVSSSGGGSSRTSVASSSSSGGGSYTVRSGDTLWKISRSQGVSVTALKSTNGLSSDVIRPGQRLKLP